MVIVEFFAGLGVVLWFLIRSLVVIVPAALFIWVYVWYIYPRFVKYTMSWERDKTVRQIRKELDLPDWVAGGFFMVGLLAFFLFALIVIQQLGAHALS